MNPETILALIQLGRFALDALEALEKGEKTEEEIVAEWAEVRTRLDSANALWEEAGQEG
ncbi:hypothetical protein [Denitrobaculum tricleocarpae]|uniref:hypothetical protein n=1 Tax=Denitrobaculum tricleocarpae TaxID=2591009 RepID=UPI0015D408C6|nr:hypothetical protein [Denitrobaculum tricleocarpae]